MTDAGLFRWVQANPYTATPANGNSSQQCTVSSCTCHAGTRVPGEWLTTYVTRRVGGQSPETEDAAQRGRENDCLPGIAHTDASGQTASLARSDARGIRDRIGGHCRQEGKGKDAEREHGGCLDLCDEMVDFVSSLVLGGPRDET